MRIASLLTVLIVLCLAGCAQPKYLVKGLTLPSGSTIVDEMESTELPSEQRLSEGEIDKVVTVNFDCPGNCDSVVSHIDQVMTKRGYHEWFEQVHNLHPDQNESLVDTPMSSLWCWLKEYAKYEVQLMDNNSIKQACKTLADEHPSLSEHTTKRIETLSESQYTLIVIRYK